MPCRSQTSLLSRRSMLRQAAGGFGLAAMASLLHESSAAAVPLVHRIPGTHHTPTAKRVIFLYMDGGPGQMDTFDPKPTLKEYDGKPFPFEMAPTQFDDNGGCFASPWAFKPGGESGVPVSDLFPFVRDMADELLVVRSMTSEFSEHTTANYFLHTGLGIAGRPSMGAWTTYGLGRENQNLPGFVVLNGGLTPPGGLECFGSAFLPATNQGSIFKPRHNGVANIMPAEPIEQQRRTLDLVDALDRSHFGFDAPDAIESAIKNQELAFRMQMEVPEVTDTSTESAATRELYGLNSPYEPTRIFGMECLLARRLCEAGVRFIEVTCPGVGHDRWDQHQNLLKGHTDNALAVDQPIAALLKDLKQRGLLDETLVIWGAEFGRTPFSQGADGRDHNPFGFSMWLAGGGMKGGATYGATDDFGYRAVEKPVEMYDLHATMLHALGFDHTRLTARFGGRDMRLTDVHGHVKHDWFA